MATENLQNTRSQFALDREFRNYFTPSFLGHGWEYSLSPNFQHENSHLVSFGSIRIQLNPVKQLVTKLLSSLFFNQNSGYVQQL